MAVNPRNPVPRPTVLTPERNGPEFDIQLQAQNAIAIVFSCRLTLVESVFLQLGLPTEGTAYVGTDAGGQAFNPGTFKTTDTGEWVGGPIVKNRLFFFQSFEKQEDSRPLTTFTSNPGGAPVGGNMTRVLTSDLLGLSSFLKTNFGYDTGPFDGLSQVTPGKPWIIKGTYNISNTSKLNFRYNRLTSSTDKNQSGSSSLGTSRPTLTRRGRPGGMLSNTVGRPCGSLCVTIRPSGLW